MNKLYHIITQGLCGVGMVNGLYSIYHTNPPYKAPDSLDIINAQILDAQALNQDFHRVLLGIGSSYTKEVKSLNV